jgi:YD repeat-containing protein
MGGTGVTSLQTTIEISCNRTELDVADAGRLTNQVVNGQSRSYAYSFRSQMTGLTDTNAASFAYEFDGEGNRVSSVGTAGPAVRFVYDDTEPGHVPTINN